MMRYDSWLDYIVDILRSRSMYSLLAGVLLGWLLFSPPAQQNIMHVTFHNRSDMLVNSILLTFGFDLNQSDLRVLQVRPGESRTISINHIPGRGFNTVVSYSDGRIQSFCANKGISGQKQEVILRP